MAFGAVHVPLHDIWLSLTGQADRRPAASRSSSSCGCRGRSARRSSAPRSASPGALLQGALANPLASPDVIGVTGGAGFGAMLTLLVWPSAIALLPVGALVFGAARGGDRVRDRLVGRARRARSARVILAGIAISALFGAATTSLMVAYSDRVQSAVFWLAGGLSSEGWSSLRSSGRTSRSASSSSVFLARPLDRLALGDDVAASLGGRPRLVRLLAAAAAALLASSAAALAGLLGFLGLGHPAPRAARRRDARRTASSIPALGARPAPRC